MPVRVTKNADDLVTRLKEHRTNRILDLSKWKLSKLRWRRITMVAKQNQSLHVLVISGDESVFHRLPDQVTKYITDMLVFNTALFHVSITGKDIADTGAIEFANALRINCTVTGLDLDANHISSVGVIALSQMLSVNTALTSLSLRGNTINDEAATDLAFAVQENTSLTMLNLASTSLSDRGASLLAQALAQNNTLTQLNLQGNKFGVQGALALADGTLHNMVWCRLQLDAELHTLVLQGHQSIVAEPMPRILNPDPLLFPPLEQLPAIPEETDEDQREEVDDAAGEHQPSERRSRLGHGDGDDDDDEGDVEVAPSKEDEQDDLVSDSKSAPKEPPPRRKSAWSESSAPGTVPAAAPTDVVPYYSPEEEPTYRWLDLAGRGVSVQDLIFVGRLLWFNDTATALDLSLNQLAGPDGTDLNGVLSLCEAIRSNKTLTLLDLQGTGLSDDCSLVLAAAVASSKTLQYVRLDDAELPVQVLRGALPTAQVDLRVPTVQQEETDWSASKSVDLAEIGSQLSSARSRNSARRRPRAKGIEQNLLSAAAGEPAPELLALTQREALVAGEIMRLSHCTSITALDGVTIDGIRTARFIDRDIEYHQVVMLGIQLRTNKSVMTLDLSSQELGLRGTRVLSSNLAFNLNVQTLMVGHSNLGPEGATFVAEALARQRIKTITCLDISWNDIGDTGACALASALTGRTETESLEALSAFVQAEIERREKERIAAIMAKSKRLTQFLGTDIKVDEPESSGDEAGGPELDEETKALMAKAKARRQAEAEEKAKEAQALALSRSKKTLPAAAGTDAANAEEATAPVKKAAGDDPGKELEDAQAQADREAKLDEELWEGVDETGAPKVEKPASDQPAPNVLQSASSVTQALSQRIEAAAELLGRKKIERPEIVVTQYSLGKLEANDPDAHVELPRTPATLTELNISGNNLKNLGVIATGIAVQHSFKLKHLTLSWNPIDQVAAEQLAAALIANPIMEELHLDNCSLGPISVVPIASAISVLPRLRRFSIAGDPLKLPPVVIGPFGVYAVAAALWHDSCGIEDLRLTDCMPGTAGCRAIGQMLLYNTRLQHLDLSCSMPSIYIPKDTVLPAAVTHGTEESGGGDASAAALTLKRPKSRSNFRGEVITNLAIICEECGINPAEVDGHMWENLMAAQIEKTTAAALARRKRAKRPTTGTARSGYASGSSKAPGTARSARSARSGRPESGRSRPLSRGTGARSDGESKADGSGDESSGEEEMPDPIQTAIDYELTNDLVEFRVPRAEEEMFGIADTAPVDTAGQLGVRQGGVRIALNQHAALSAAAAFREPTAEELEEEKSKVKEADIYAEMDKKANQVQDLSDAQLLRFAMDKDNAFILARGLAANTTLKSLNLRGNSIGNDGVKALGRVLTHNLKLQASLTALDIGMNNVDLDTIQYIIGKMKNESVFKHVDVRNNKLTQVQLRDLRDESGRLMAIHG